MQHIKRILVATDLSEQAGKAIRRAGMLSEDLKCWIVEMLAVAEDCFGDVAPRGSSSRITAPKTAEADRIGANLNSAAETLQCHFRVRCNPSVRFGQPALEILNRGEEVKADLIVIGNHGRGFAGEFSVGSNADKLMCMATRPVLIVKNPPARSYQHVLILVDFSNDAMHAAQMALQLAPHAHITFLYVFLLPYDKQAPVIDACPKVIGEPSREVVNEIERRLEGFIAALELRTDRVSRVVRYGRPTDEIIRYANAKRPDLIAIGKHGRSRLPALVLGSVTRRTVIQTFCDVIVATAGGGNVIQWQGPHAA